MDADTIYRRRWLTLVVLSMSLVLIGLDNQTLNVALPARPPDDEAREALYGEMDSDPVS